MFEKFEAGGTVSYSGIAEKVLVLVNMPDVPEAEVASSDDEDVRDVVVPLDDELRGIDSVVEASTKESRRDHVDIMKSRRRLCEDNRERSGGSLLKCLSSSSCLMPFYLLSFEPYDISVV